MGSTQAITQATPSRTYPSLRAAAIPLCVLCGKGFDLGKSLTAKFAKTLGKGRKERPTHLRFWGIAPRPCKIKTYDGSHFPTDTD